MGIMGIRHEPGGLESRGNAQQHMRGSSYSRRANGTSERTDLCDCICV